MKQKYTLKTAAVILLSVLTVNVFAQKDTTEFEVGKKKLIIIDKKTQNENAVYNLEKGKEAFENEIIIVEKLIQDREKEMKELEFQIQTLIKNLHTDGAGKKIKIEYKISGIDDSKIDSINKEIETEIEKDIDIIILGDENEISDSLKRIPDFNTEELQMLIKKLEQQKELLNLNTKKKYAFEYGIQEIEKGIEEIEKGLGEMDDELKTIDSEREDKREKKENRKSRFNAHLSGFDFGILNFLNNRNTFISEEDAGIIAVIPEKTFSYGLNLFEFNIPITKNSLGFATGAGIEWNSLNLSENVNLYKASDGVIVAIETGITDVKRNKLNVTYITIPLVLEFQTPVKNKKLYVSAGAFGGIRGWSKQKLVYEVGGVKYKDKTKDDFSLSPFRYGLTARVGYGDVGIFAEYSLVPLFKDGKGPEMYPIMIGVRLADF